MEFTAAVFVIGCPRSGTSALSWALDKHPALWTSAEADLIFNLYGPRGNLRKIYHEIANSPRGDTLWLNRNNVSYREFAKHIGYGIDQLYLSRSGGKRWVDQTPKHARIAPDLMHMFPRAKFLHLIRDGRQVVNSMINSGFDMAWATDFELACKTWNHYISIGLPLESRYPKRVMQVRNEDLVDKREETCSQILEFLKLKPQEGPVKFLENKWVNSSFGGDRQTPVDPWAIWDENQRETFTRIAGESLAKLGYQ